jgi:hypothetical protein
VNDLTGQALEALRFGWGDAYEISCDGGWQARRRDGLGDDITAPDPDALWAAICEDYALKPVPRDLPLAAGGEQ